MVLQYRIRLFQRGGFRAGERRGEGGEGGARVGSDSSQHDRLRETGEQVRRGTDSELASETRMRFSS